MVNLQCRLTKIIGASQSQIGNDEIHYEVVEAKTRKVVDSSYSTNAFYIVENVESYFMLPEKYPEGYKLDFMFDPTQWDLTSQVGSVMVWQSHYSKNRLVNDDKSVIITVQDLLGALSAALEKNGDIGQDRWHYRDLDEKTRDQILKALEEYDNERGIAQ